VALQRLRRESESGAAFEQGFALMDSASRSRLTRLSQILPRGDSLRYEHVSRARQELTNEQFWRDADILRLNAANEIHKVSFHFLNRCWIPFSFFSEKL
jgi:hypothetical protein